MHLSTHTLHIHPQTHTHTKTLSLTNTPEGIHTVVLTLFPHVQKPIEGRHSIEEAIALHRVRVNQVRNESLQVVLLEELEECHRDFV